MAYTIQTNLPLGLIVFASQGAVNPDEVEPSRILFAQALSGGDIDRVILDGRALSASPMTGPLARGLLTTFDSQMDKIWQGSDRKMRIAVLGVPGTLGYGIARLITGHAYDLKRLEVSTVASAEEAKTYLGLDDDWETGLETVPLPPLA